MAEAEFVGAAVNEDMVHRIVTDASAPNGHPGALEMRVWAARITECWRSSVEGIIRTGRLLVEAKADLAHGEFGAMCTRELPFTQRTAQMLMAIAEDQRLTNAKFISYLPASWGTLYELTKLSDAEFDSAVQQHVIRPDMLRGEAELIRPLTHRPPQSDAGAHLREGNDAANGTAPQPAELEPQTQVEDRPASPDPLPPMPSGGLAIAHNRVESADSLDFFPTPPWATRALIEHTLAHLERSGHCKFQSVWEPACGEGHMAEPLKEYFRSVHATDIKNYGYSDDLIDFLEWSPARTFDWIITNPPFGDKMDAFILRALELAGTGVAMFVRLQCLETVGRYEKIFRDKPPTLISFFCERVPLHKGRWEPEGATFTAYIWLVWIKGAEPRAPFWIPPCCRVALSKPEDVKKFGKAIVEGEAA